MYWQVFYHFTASMKTFFKLFLLITAFIFVSVEADSQQKTITGLVKDSHSDEVIPLLLSNLLTLVWVNLQIAQATSSSI